MTCVPLIGSTKGATFSEVLVAMTLLLIGLMGAVEAFHVAHKGIGRSLLASRALAMAESRLEAKRALRWDQLLTDDLDYDGVAELVMHDDGSGGDRLAGDGVFSAMSEQNGIHLTWTVTPNRSVPLSQTGYVLIDVRASYRSDQGDQEVRLATIRANPAFAGAP